ncbi:ABC transporter permease [Gordonia terrae]|uniref:ABC transporter permease n=2 Tax=Gordonia terrae TaxID=2055 RepID=A0AAD0KAK2_9ACTN|nr:ABC transporter permease [Gordonia terrae]VTR09611.1 peptide ABC transporter permease [Clostridioides difficile]ANY22222.1 peptide ABC transporter [Gordonia terrae]AWO82962.1 ABC transporter permease [Gordonia terrae]VTS29989.1 Dipeptide transport system permease protein dppB [Gordonia terrae]GAB46310.1 putative ABC transporter permease protein [Gordonia terrae NBRC 100016]
MTRLGAGRYVAKLGIVLALVSIATFLLLELIPGDPVDTVLPAGATPEMRAAAMQLYGLDGSLVSRYFDWLGSAFQGDLGRSMQSQLPVTDAILARLPVTIELAALSIILALLIAIPVGVVSAYRPGGIVDRIATFICSITLSIPSFLLGVLLVFIFAVSLGVLPVTGWTPLSEGLVPHIESLILPVITLSAIEAVGFIRVLRNDMIATLQQDFVLSARARGLPSSRILFTHALRPSAFSLVTVLGVTLGRLIGGTVIVETLFSLPGLGSLVITAITGRDFVMVQGIVLVVAVAYVLLNALVDLVYPVLDPRVRTA